MIRAILWDIDGTLLDFLAAERESIFKGFSHFQIGTCTEEMLEDYSCINRKYWEALERGELTKKQVLEGRFVEFFEKYQIPATVAVPFNELYQKNLGDTVVFRDNSYELITKLKGKLLQYVVTNGTTQAQERKLSKSGFGTLMDGIFISDQIGAEKPTKEFFVPVFEALYKALPDLKKEEILIVGDSLTSDMRGGNNVGVRTCWYNPGKQKNSYPVPVEFEITDLWELEEILGKIE